MAPGRCNVLLSCWSDIAWAAQCGFDVRGFRGFHFAFEALSWSKSSTRRASQCLSSCQIPNILQLYTNFSQHFTACHRLGWWCSRQAQGGTAWLQDLAVAVAAQLRSPSSTPCSTNFNSRCLPGAVCFNRRTSSSVNCYELLLPIATLQGGVATWDVGWTRLGW